MFWCLGQVQVPGHTGRICRESQGPTPPPQVLWSTSDGGAGGGSLRITLPCIKRHRIEGSTVTHHLQYGYVCVSPQLGLLDGGTGVGGAEAITTEKCCIRKGGQPGKGTMADGGQKRGMQGWCWRRRFLCGRRTGGFHRPMVDPVCILYADRDLWPGISSGKRPQDRGGGMQAILGIRGAGRRVLHTEDDRGGT